MVVDQGCVQTYFLIYSQPRQEFLSPSHRKMLQGMTSVPVPPRNCVACCMSHLGSPGLLHLHGRVPHPLPAFILVLRLTPVLAQALELSVLRLVLSVIDRRSKGSPWERRGGMNWETGIDICTLLYVKQITNENLLSSSGSHTPQIGKKSKKRVYMCMYN